MGKETRRGNASDRYLRQRRQASAQNDGHSISRRGLLIGGATLFLASTGVGVYLLSGETEGKEKVFGKSLEDIKVFYPELGDKEVRANGSFDTDLKHIDWYNFSSFNLDPVAARSVYLLAEQLTSDDWAASTRLDGETKKITFEKTNRPIKLFVVDYDIPFTLNGRYMDKTRQQLRDFTFQGLTYNYQAQDNSPLITVIRIPTSEQLKIIRGSVNNDPISNSLNTIATEAFQASVRATIEKLGNDPRLQETAANSFGSSVELAYNNYSYEAHKNVAKGGITPDGSEIPFISYTESAYSKFRLKNPFSK